MKFQQIVSNKWVKRGALLLALVGVAFGANAARKRIIAKNNNNSDDDSGVWDNSIVSDVVDTANNVNAPTVTGMTKMKILAYNRTAIAFGDKLYSFTKDGVKKMQTYFAKNAAARQLIEKSGGIDGVIGETFAKILVNVLQQNKARLSVKDYLDKTFPGIIKNAGLTSQDVSITRL